MSYALSTAMQQFLKSFADMHVNTSRDRHTASNMILGIEDKANRTIGGRSGSRPRPYFDASIAAE